MSDRNSKRSRRNPINQRKQYPEKIKIRFLPIVLIILLFILTLIITIQLLSPQKVSITSKAEVPPQTLLNPSFEETSGDGNGSYDPKDWTVIEGYATPGTGHVSPEDENKELVRVVGQINGVTPFDGEKMIEISNRRYLKAAVMQYFAQAITTGKFTQELAVYPASNQYLQQLEVRGRPDFPEVYGLQLYSLKFSNSSLEVCVRTGGPDADHICGYDQLLPPLSINRWSEIKTELEKVDSTADGVSQWKLTILLNDEVIFSSGTDNYPFVQYIKDLRHVFIGDECENGITQKCDGPDGIIYYDAAFAQNSALQDENTSVSREKADLGLIVNRKNSSNPEMVKATWSDSPLTDQNFGEFTVVIRKTSDDTLVSPGSERSVARKTQKVFDNVYLSNGEYYVKLIAKYKNNVYQHQNKYFSYVNGRIIPHE